jgi:Do/DeqQ family serine protease
MPDEIYSAPNVPPAVRYRPNSGLIWVLLLLLIMWLLPNFVERMKYASTRGRERAEVEGAREEIKSLNLDNLGHAFGLVAKSVGPSVVHINTVRRLNGRRSNDDELDALFGGFGGMQREALGQGSGVIVDKAGYIITNNHVVEGASNIQVILSTGQQLEGSVVGFDRLTDLAVLRVRSSDLIAAEWGDSDQLQVGSLVWAIGNPFGLDRSVTFGIISAKDRHVIEGYSNPYQSFLQTDAAVNPGNSGGPLVNIEGQVVGINTAIIGRAYQGISFSIPSSIAREVYQKLIANGKVPRGYLGVQLAELTPEIAKKLGLKAAEGALVASIRDGSPAEKAGLEPGDVIVRWNTQEIDDPQKLTLLVAQSEVGSTAELLIIRDGEEIKKKVQVEERPPVD